MLEKCNKCISKIQLLLQEMNLKRPSARFSIPAIIFQFREFPLIPQEASSRCYHTQCEDSLHKRVSCNPSSTHNLEQVIPVPPNHNQWILFSQ
jgi:hypothetical protein